MFFSQFLVFANWNKNRIENQNENKFYFQHKRFNTVRPLSFSNTDLIEKNSSIFLQEMASSNEVITSQIIVLIDS